MILFITAYVRKSFSALESSEIFELCAILRKLCLASSKNNFIRVMFSLHGAKPLLPNVSDLLAFGAGGNGDKTSPWQVRLKS